jgi:hypothetical protein
MKVNFVHSTQTLLVTLDLEEARRINAFLYDRLEKAMDHAADVPALLEDALREIIA